MSRTTEAPLTKRHDLAEAVMAARSELDTASKNLLETFNLRVAQREALDPEAKPGTVARAVYAEDQAELERLSKAVKEAQQAFEPHVETYVFRPVGFAAYAALKKKYPLGSKDVPLFKGADWDVIRGAQDLINASLVSPNLSKDEVKDLIEGDTYSYGEILLLLIAAVQVQL